VVKNIGVMRWQEEPEPRHVKSDKNANSNSKTKVFVAMSDDGKVTPPPPGGGAPDAAEMGEIAKNQAALQWEQAMAAFGKATMPAGAPYMPGNVPFNMPFPAVRSFLTLS
jgi:hypothetical protein